MKKSILLSLITLVLFSACNRDGVSNAELRKLERAKETWQKTKTSDYSFNYRQSCFCVYIPEVTVQVFADTVFALLDPQTGEDATIETENGDVKMIDVYGAIFKTVDDLFETLEEAAMVADEMNGTYDNERGFPAQVHIDRYKNGVDDEISYFLNNFQVLTLSKN